MVNEDSIQIGDVVSVMVQYLENLKASTTYRRVRVTQLHSGYYDESYTGIDVESDKTVYFSWYGDGYKGRVV